MQNHIGQTLNLAEAEFKKITRRFDPGEFIFNQDEPGRTMYLILEGTVKVIEKIGNFQHLIAILGPGEVVGERGIVDETPYRRNFSAQCKTTCTTLEIDSKSLQTVIKRVPDFHIRVLKMVLDRLDKANAMISIVQINDPFERLAEYILYFDKYHNKKMPNGTDLSFTAAEIEHAINLPRNFIDLSISELIQHKILAQNPNGYVVSSRDALTTLLAASAKKHKTAA